MNDFEQLNNTFLQHQMIHEQMRHDQYLRQQEEIRRQQRELEKRAPFGSLISRHANNSL